MGMHLFRQYIRYLSIYVHAFVNQIYMYNIQLKNIRKNVCMYLYVGHKITKQKYVCMSMCTWCR